MARKKTKKATTKKKTVSREAKLNQELSKIRQEKEKQRTLKRKQKNLKLNQWFEENVIGRCFESYDNYGWPSNRDLQISNDKKRKVIFRFSGLKKSQWASSAIIDLVMTNGEQGIFIKNYPLPFQGIEKIKKSLSLLPKYGNLLADHMDKPNPWNSRTNQSDPWEKVVRSLKWDEVEKIVKTLAPFKREITTEQYDQAMGAVLGIEIQSEETNGTPEPKKKKNASEQRRVPAGKH